MSPQRRRTDVFLQQRNIPNHLSPSERHAAASRANRDSAEAEFPPRFSAQRGRTSCLLLINEAHLASLPAALPPRLLPGNNTSERLTRSCHTFFFFFLSFSSASHPGSVHQNDTFQQHCHFFFFLSFFSLPLRLTR